MSTEITIIVKDSERQLKQKFLSYEKVTLDYEDPIIKGFTDEVIKGFNGEPEDVIVRAMMVWQ